MDSHKKWHAYTTGVAVFTSAFFLTLLVSSLIIPIHNSNADTNSSSSASADGYSLSLSATGNVNLDLIVSYVDTMTIGLGNVTVSTTSPGYRLYIGMTGNSTALTSANSESIDATSGTLSTPVMLSRNTWGYAIPKNTTHVVENNFAESYTAASSITPDSSKTFSHPPAGNQNPELIATSSTATTGTGDSYPIYYGIRANQDTTPGSYTNNVLFTAVADAGASDTVTLTPNNIAANVAARIEVKTTMYSTATDATADVYLLTRAQYNSLTDHNVEGLGVSPLSCAKTSSTPITYSCLVPKSTSGDYNIYVKSAKYDKVYANTFTVDALASFFTISNMQDMTYAVCSSVPTPPADATADEVPTTVLGDTRDTNSYTVKKLADGRCWMTENLRLVGEKVLTPSDSDVASNFTLSASDSGTWCQSQTAACINKSMVLESDNSSYGAYYNWYAATAGTGIRDMAEGEYAESSICPKGWHLPSGETYGEYQTLIDSGYSRELIRGIPNFKQAGIIQGSIQNPSTGYYWTNLSGVTSSTTGATTANYLGVYSKSVVVSGHSTYKHYGLNVRCVSDQPEFYTVKTMQQMTASVCDSVPTPSAAATKTDTTGEYVSNNNYVPERTLLDIRNGETYRVRKLADGNCWMTENLRLGDSTEEITLTASDSDVTSDFVLPIAQTSGNNTWSDNTNSTNSKHIYATGNTDYGNYYNWYTATAGTGTSTMRSTSATDLLNATSSICPKGWRLPDGGQSTKMSFYQLDKAYGGSGANRTDTAQRDKFRASLLNFSYSGDYGYEKGVENQGSVGLWWTRSAYTTSGTPYTFRNGNNAAFKPQNFNNGGSGFSVRCLAETRTLFDIDKMQEMTPQIVKNTTTPLASATQVDTNGTHKGDVTYVPQNTLTDVRDSKTYQVKKLADGNVWMTQNLALGSGSSTITLHSYDSDVSSDWELPIAQTSGSDVWSDAANSTDSKHVYATGNTNYGNYYNWLTATAGTGLGSMTSTSATSLNNVYVSICPRGWRLPDGGQSLSKSFYALDKAYGGSGADRTDATQANKFKASILNFIYTGYYFYPGGVAAQGETALWWSRSASTNAGKPYAFRTGDNGNFRPQGNTFNAGSGFSVRCLVK